jgi:hypothetical protein
MSDKYHHHNHYNTKIFLIAISTAALAGSFLISSQFVESSLTQDIGQSVEEQIRERIGGEIEQLIVGNETGNQTGNQTDNQSGGSAEQLAQQTRGILGQ